jgi:hypothetical protein
MLYGLLSPSEINGLARHSCELSEAARLIELARVEIETRDENFNGDCQFQRFVFLLKASVLEKKFGFAVRPARLS